MPQRSIRFHVGGPDFHPVAEQARVIAAWLGSSYRCSIREGHDAFEGLDEIDLFVPMGLFWTGAKDANEQPAYVPIGDRQKQSFERYIASGRSLVIHHGAIASYDDWPRFGELLGFTWVWGTTAHSPIGTHAVRVLPSGHPIVAGVLDYELVDELYYGIRVNPGLSPQVLATARWNGVDHPMVMAAAGGAGRVEGAGRVVYLANGHDLRAFECAALKQIWINSVLWALEG